MEKDEKMKAVEYLSAFYVILVTMLILPIAIFLSFIDWIFKMLYIVKNWRALLWRK